MEVRGPRRVHQHNYTITGIANLFFVFLLRYFCPFLYTVFLPLLVPLLKMKFIAPSILYTSACIAAVSAAPSTGSTYNIRVGSDNPAIKDALVTVKDESATTSPNAIGVWSTGEPRSAYTLTISSNHVNPKLFECKGTVKQTHLILNGPRAAMALYDVPIGADPTPKKGEALFTNAFTRWEEKGIRFADRYKAGGDPNDLIGAGSWRACKGDSEIDYQLYWYDGEPSSPVSSSH